MLTKSRQPQILRLHELEDQQRNRYISECSSVIQQWLPDKLWPALPLFADIYYAYTTICKCRRRLGQQYTYVAMYNEKHYEQEGVLVNNKNRLLMFVLQILQRHLLKLVMKKVWSNMEEKLGKGGKWRILRDMMSVGIEGFIEQGKIFMLMLFLLGWNKHYNLIDTILRNQYVYTFLNKNNAKVDYRIEGYMLLTVFVVRSLRFAVKIYKTLTQKQKVIKKMVDNSTLEVPKEQKQQLKEQEEELCRICYDNISNKSVTVCGHIFCWDCILKYLNTHPECPVCRSTCEPKEIIQLQNY